MDKNSSLTPRRNDQYSELKKNEDAEIEDNNNSNSEIRISVHEDKANPPPQNSSNQPDLSPATLFLYKLVSLIVITIFTVAVNILVKYSGSQKGSQYKYNPTSVVLVAELLKFFISFIGAYRSNLIDSEFFNKYIDQDFWKYGVPAFIYVVQNNLVFYCLMYMNVTAYTILSQLKILTTGVFFCFILKKKLTNLQWVSLLLLCVGCATTQLSSGEGETFSVSSTGLILLGIIVSLSALAGVINEFLLKNVGKGANSNLHIQNMKLYFFGIVINILASLYTVTNITQLFIGYNFLAFSISFMLAITGLAVSAAMKYANVIVKTFAASLAMVLTSVVSILLFNFTPTLTLWDGIIIIACALYSYNYESTLKQ